MRAALKTGREPRFEAPGLSLAPEQDRLSDPRPLLVALPGGRRHRRSGLHISMRPVVRGITWIVAVSARLLRILAAVLTWAVPIAAMLAMGFFAVGPRTGAYRTLTVLTGSMRPGMPPGSVVVVSPMPVTSVKPGDVITYNAPIEDHRVVTHRVVWTRQHNGHVLIQTKGDANNGIDPWIAEVSGSTVWKVRTSFPWAGRAIIALRSPKVRKLGLTVVPALLAIVWISEIWRKKDDEPSAESGDDG